MTATYAHRVLALPTSMISVLQGPKISYIAMQLGLMDAKDIKPQPIFIAALAKYFERSVSDRLELFLAARNEGTLLLVSTFDKASMSRRIPEDLVELLKTETVRINQALEDGSKRYSWTKLAAEIFYLELVALEVIEPVGGDANAV